MDTLPEPTEEFHTLAKKYNVKTSYHRCDITKQQSLESAFEDAVKAMGQLHGGFTAAGICFDEKLIEADWERTLTLLHVNVMGTFWAAKLISKHLVETKTPGSIVFVASISSHGFHTPVSLCIRETSSRRDEAKHTNLCCDHRFKQLRSTMHRKRL